MLIKNSSILRPMNKMHNTIVRVSNLFPRQTNINNVIRDSTLECYFDNPDGFVSLFEGAERKVTTDYRSHIISNFKVVCIDDRDGSGIIMPLHKMTNYVSKTGLKYLSSMTNYPRTFRMISRIVRYR